MNASMTATMPSTLRMKPRRTAASRKPSAHRAAWTGVRCWQHEACKHSMPRTHRCLCAGCAHNALGSHLRGLHIIVELRLGRWRPRGPWSPARIALLCTLRVAPGLLLLLLLLLRRSILLIVPLRVVGRRLRILPVLRRVLLRREGACVDPQQVIKQV